MKMEQIQKVADIVTEIGKINTLDAAMARSSARGTRPPGKPLPLIGFRVVRALTDEERTFERLAAE